MFIRTSRRKHQIYMVACDRIAGCLHTKAGMLHKTWRYDSTPRIRWRMNGAQPVKASISVGSLSQQLTPPTNCLGTCRPCYFSGDLKGLSDNSGVVKLVAFQTCYFVSFPEAQRAAFSAFPFFAPRRFSYILPSTLAEKQRFYSVAADHVKEVCVVKANQGRVATAGTRISRTARAEAQKALMEYLHGTKGLAYTDAEHISKYSPVFINSLLAKVPNEQQVRQYLLKFLQYHPINEFEPFFESLGLKPSEFQSLLPHGQYFLHDDKVMLHNFQALCNFGFARSKIGKMLKEAREIFEYDCGTLEARIQAYLNLGLCTSTVIKLVSCSPSLLVGDVNQEFLQVLEKLRSLGFGHFWIRGCLMENSEYCWAKMLQTIKFLSEMGCSEENLKDLIVRHPWFIFNESGKKVFIFSALLLKLGFKMDKIVQLLMHCPQILSRRFVKNLHRSIDFLVEIGLGTDEIAEIIYSHPQTMNYHIVKKPASVLSRLKVDKEFLRNLIARDPRKLQDLASSSKIRSMITMNRNDPMEKTMFLLKLGFQENTEEMLTAQDRICGRVDQLQERFDVLLSAGLDFHDACNIVREAPGVLNQTAETLEKKINYLVTHAGYPLNSLSRFPTCLCHSLDKIKLRLLMLHWLKQKGVVRTTVSLSYIVASSASDFERYFVNKVPDGPDVWKKIKESYST